MAADQLLVLHGLRLKGFAEAGAVAALFGLQEPDVAVALKELADDGLVQRRDGRVSGWSLTAEGRTVEAELLAEELERSGARDQVDLGYEQFVAVNGELLDVCTAWQLKSVDGAQTINDHADVSYDTATVDRLGAVHATAAPVVASLGGALERFSGYGPRLEHALGRVQAGETEWFTKPLLDSYHTVWFELHEDLLSTLGKQRGAEGR
jgi:DNA-binding MarR family transcriptional regulator